MGIYYYVSKQSGYNNNHVVHAAGCKFIPPLESRLFLGTFYTPAAAILQARKYYQGALGCEACCPLPQKKTLTTQHSVALRHTT